MHTRTHTVLSLCTGYFSRMANFHLGLLPLLAVTVTAMKAKQAPVNNAVDDAEVFSWGKFPDKCLMGRRHLVSTQGGFRKRSRGHNPPPLGWGN